MNTCVEFVTLALAKFRKLAPVLLSAMTAMGCSVLAKVAAVVCLGLSLLLKEFWATVQPQAS